MVAGERVAVVNSVSGSGDTTVRKSRETRKWTAWYSPNRRAVVELGEVKVRSLWFVSISSRLQEHEELIDGDALT